MALSCLDSLLLQNKIVAKMVTKDPVRMPMIKIKVPFPESVLLLAGFVFAFVSCYSGVGTGVGSGVGGLGSVLFVFGTGLGVGGLLSVFPPVGSTSPPEAACL